MIKGEDKIFFGKNETKFHSIWSGKITAIRRIAVRETGISRYHRDPIKGSPETPRTSQHFYIGGFKGALNWDPIMPRDASLSDSECKFSTLAQHETSIP